MKFVHKSMGLYSGELIAERNFGSAIDEAYFPIPIILIISFKGTLFPHFIAN